jgi:hypothetical protein
LGLVSLEFAGRNVVFVELENAMRKFEGVVLGAFVGFCGSASAIRSKSISAHLLTNCISCQQKVDDIPTLYINDIL